LLHPVDLCHIYLVQFFMTMIGSTIIKNANIRKDRDRVCGEMNDYNKLTREAAEDNKLTREAAENPKSVRCQ
jgi:hypothetical protein